MAEEGGDPLEGKELEFTIEVSCRKGEPVPQSTLGLTALSKQDTAEGAEEENDEEKEEEHVPTFEELGCQFHLTMFDGEAMVSEVLQFNADPPEEPEAAEGEEGEEGQEKKEKKPHDPNLWTHTFTTTATINEDAIVKICKSAQSSISLRREDLEVPLVLLPLDLCAMVAGERVLEFGVSLAHTELYEDPFNVAEFNVKISIPEALLTNELEEKLNPLCITIVAAEDMPDHAKYELGGTWKDGKNPSTRSLAELQQECLPVYCKYTFMQPAPPKPKSEEKEQEEEEVEHPDWCCEVVTNSLPQSRKVKFKHRKVFLAGLIHPDDLIQHLKDNKIVVEVHDRDRIPPVSKQGSEESNGDGGEEQETPAIPVWSGLASIDKARAEEPLLENPYAVCAISLAPLCDGRQFVVERNDLGPKRINYPAFSAHIKPTLGDYVESGSVLVVKAELRRPLRSATLFPSGPFQRVVYKIQYSNAGMLTKLNESIVRANCAALSKRTKIEPPPTPTPRSSKEEKEERAKWEENPDAEGPPVNEMVYNMVQDGAPLSMLEKALNGVEITPEQAQDPEFDIITGVEVIDSNNRIFILEGLASGAILKLLEDCPREGKNTREMKVLYNQEITFTQRLYGAYNVSVKKIKLRESLRHLILKVDTYLEPKYMLTAGALMRLNEISRAGRMKKLRDLVLFPSVAQLEHMYKKLGDALSIEDLTGRKPENKVKKGHEDDMPELTKEELAAATAMPRPKAKAPTESHNPVYLQFLATKPPPSDFEQLNIEAVKQVGTRHRPERELDYGEVYNYSGQTLQYGALQKDFQRERYAKDYGKIHWTYSKDLLSGAFVLQDTEQAARDAKRRNKDRWLTEKGFQWPIARTATEFMTQQVPKAIHTDPNVDADPWVEGENFGGVATREQTLQPGQPDFNVVFNSQPRMFEQNPEMLKSVFAAEGGAALEAQERKSQTYREWLQKMAVEDKRFHTLWNSGKGQMDRQKPLLKTNPQKMALRTMPAPDGCQLSVAFPASMETREQYIDPIRTFVLDTYGIKLRFGEKSADDPTATMRWGEPMATGVKEERETVTHHTQGFKGYAKKGKAEQHVLEKIVTRPIHPLNDTKEDRPPLLYYEKKQVQASSE